MDSVQTWISAMPLSTAVAIGAVCLSIVMYTFVYSKAPNFTNRRLPPGPRPWPVVGNIPVFLTSSEPPHRTMMRLSKKYGSLVFLRLGSVPGVVVSSPRMAEAFLKTYDHVFASRLDIAQSELLAYNGTTVLSAPYGEDWRYLRRIWASEILSPKRLEQFQSMRRTQKESFLRSILAQSQGGEKVRIGLMFAQFSTNQITRMLAHMDGSYMGKDPVAFKRSVEFQENIKEITRLSGVMELGDYLPFLKRWDVQGYRKAMAAANAKLDIILQNLIGEHRQHLVKGKSAKDYDLIDVLLTLPRQSKDRVLTDIQLRGILNNMVLAGTDTQAATLEWGLAEMMRHPQVVKKAQEELDSVVGQERLVEESDLPNLKYMQAIVKETLRLHPAVPLLIPRSSIADCEVEGLFIPAKSVIYINAYAISRDPEIWDRSLDFWPERFVEGSGLSAALDVHGMHFEVFPFGSGRRICPGKNLALLVVQHTLALMIQCFDWGLPTGESLEDLDMTEQFGITLPKAVPLESVPRIRMPSLVKLLQ